MFTRNLRNLCELAMAKTLYRFHSWQSGILFTAVFIIYLIFSWSTFLSWVVFLAALGLMGFLAMHAYRDADTLDRYVTFFGYCNITVLKN